MEKTLTVLVVEDNQDECNKLVQLIDSLDDINLAGVTNNVHKALEYVKDYLPDAVILDLELQRGNGNGIWFLEALKEMSTGFLPYIIVTTYNVNYLTHECARQLGAGFIILKNKKDYNAVSVINLIQSLKENILVLRNITRGREGTSDEALYVIRKRQKARIAVEIDRIGISPKALGRNYLVDFILQRIGGHSNHIEKIAQKSLKTNTSVERAMQNAINKAWSTVHPDDLAQYYTAPIHSDRGVPTVMEFISHYADKIKLDYEN